MEKIKAFFKRKDIILSSKRYGIDALGAMAQGLFCTLLVGTILNTIGQQFHIGFLTKIITGTYTIGEAVAQIGEKGYGSLAEAVKAVEEVMLAL